MKKTILLILFLLAIHSSYCQNNGDTIISNNPSNLRVRVLYFHITNRCHTCYSIEEQLRGVLFGNFSEKISNGMMELFIINADLPENKELVKKYDAYGATLAITGFAQGKETATTDLTGWAFQKINKTDTFRKELKEKIDELLK